MRSRISQPIRAIMGVAAAIAATRISSTGRPAMWWLINWCLPVLCVTD